jgi:RimJ/RimL family protein N-acetyltransferase
VEVGFQRFRSPDDDAGAVAFLTSNTWPFHAAPQLSTAGAANLTLAADDVTTFWIVIDPTTRTTAGTTAGTTSGTTIGMTTGTTIGMIRIFDLDDVDDGSPLFDLRIVESFRGRGIGTRAVTWLTDHLFTTYSTLHRVEATTRHDNLGMQTVLTRTGYRLEGRMVEAWKNDDGTRSDTLTYAILRREWRSGPSS